MKGRIKRAMSIIRGRIKSTMSLIKGMKKVRSTHLFSNLLTGLITTTVVLTMSGCQTKDEPKNLIVTPKESTEEIAPTVQVEEKYYGGLSPLEPSTSRGLLLAGSTLDQYRLDAERLELGLLEIAQGYFALGDHLFMEGQVISKDDLSEWLRIKSEKYPGGLNPEGSSERILRYILEHNYTDEKGKLKGMVLGLSLASTYEVTKDGETKTMIYTDDELRNFGIEMAEQLIPNIRRSQDDIPIVIALYKLEEKHSLAPGNFLSVGFVKKKENRIEDWKSIQEIYFLFPSQAISSYKPELSKSFTNYKKNVEAFFPNYVGVIGTGRFIEEKLVELTIDVTTEFASKTEAIQLTQFLGGRAIETFSEDVHLNIYVKSVNEPQSIFIRPIDGEAVMHVYR
jgi:protein involved in sex pheromone biosynthesis